MSPLSSIRTAVLFSAYGSRASYYDDWLDAFRSADAFDVNCFNIAKPAESKKFTKTVESFDLIIALHSVNADNLVYALDIKSALKSRKGLFLSFVGNEVSLPGSPLNLKIDYLHEVEADFIATQLILESGQFLYESTGAKVLAVPHALNPKVFFPAISNVERSVDIGMRTFRYPSAFLGDDERNRLFNLFFSNKFVPKLSVDLSDNKRLNRIDWANFLNRCKGTVANEAGGYWLEKDDATMLEIKRWLMSKNAHSITIKSNSQFRRFVHKLPWGVRQILVKILSRGPIKHEALIGEDVEFSEVYERFFSKKPWPPQITGKCVSSRHFDAAGTKTCQIMIEGRFNDIFKADEHFIPLKRDLSDAEEAVRKFCDRALQKELVERTFEYVMDGHTYKHRIKQIEKIIRSH